MMGLENLPRSDQKKPTPVWALFFNSIEAHMCRKNAWIIPEK